MTPNEWVRAHRVRHDEGTPTTCSECENEVGAFEVDGNRERWGYGCVRAVLAAPPLPMLTLEELQRRLRGEEA